MTDNILKDSVTVMVREPKVATRFCQYCGRSMLSLEAKFKVENDIAEFPEGHKRVMTYFCAVCETDRRAEAPK